MAPNPEVWNPSSELSGERRASPVDEPDDSDTGSAAFPYHNSADVSSAAFPYHEPRNLLDSVLKAANGETGGLGAPHLPTTRPAGLSAQGRKRWVSLDWAGWG